MPRRQLWLFKFGCWVACGVAVLQVAGLLVSPLPAPAGGDAEGLRAAAAFRVVFPDGTERPLGDLFVGFSLVYALFAATIGGVGLAADPLGRNDARLMAVIARVQALACLILLLISLTHFFLVPTLLVAVMLVCFTLAAVRAPAEEKSP